MLDSDCMYIFSKHLFHFFVKRVISHLASTQNFQKRIIKVNYFYMVNFFINLWHYYYPIAEITQTQRKAQKQIET